MFLGLLQARASCWLANRASHGVASLRVLASAPCRQSPLTAVRLLSSVAGDDGEPTTKATPAASTASRGGNAKRLLIGELSREFDEISDGSDDERLLAEDDAALGTSYPTLDSTELGELSDDEEVPAGKLSRNEQAAADMDDALWRPRVISGLGETDIRFIDADPEGEGPVLNAIASELDADSLKQLKRRVRIGNLHKPGEQPESDCDEEAQPVLPHDLDTAEERTIKEEFPRHHIKELRPLLRQPGPSEDLDIHVAQAEGAASSDSDSDMQRNDKDGVGSELVYGTESDSDDADDAVGRAEPLVYGDIRQIEDRLRAEDAAKQAAARRILSDRADQTMFTIDQAEADDYNARQTSLMREGRTPLAQLQYTKLYPATPRRWVENLKTPPGWFDSDTGHWQGVEFGDDHEYSEYWKMSLPLIAAEREAAIKRDSPKGLKVVPPADTEGYYRFGITQAEVDSIPDINKKVMAAISFKEAPQREINQFRKERAIEKWSYKPGDTGSTPVQIAILSERINYLSDHLTRNPKDKHSAYGFQRLRNRRKALLRYLKKKDTPMFVKVLRELNIRDV